MILSTALWARQRRGELLRRREREVLAPACGSADPEIVTLLRYVDNGSQPPPAARVPTGGAAGSGHGHGAGSRSVSCAVSQAGEVLCLEHSPEGLAAARPISLGFLVPGRSLLRILGRDAERASQRAGPVPRQTLGCELFLFDSPLPDTSACVVEGDGGGDAAGSPWSLFGRRPSSDTLRAKEGSNQTAGGACVKPAGADGAGGDPTGVRDCEAAGGGRWVALYAWSAGHFETFVDTVNEVLQAQSESESPAVLEPVAGDGPLAWSSSAATAQPEQEAPEKAGGVGYVTAPKEQSEPGFERSDSDDSSASNSPNSSFLTRTIHQPAIRHEEAGQTEAPPVASEKSDSGPSCSGGTARRAVMDKETAAGAADAAAGALALRREIAELRADVARGLAALLAVDARALALLALATPDESGAAAASVTAAAALEDAGQSGRDGPAAVRGAGLTTGVLEPAPVLESAVSADYCPASSPTDAAEGQRGGWKHVPAATQQAQVRRRVEALQSDSRSFKEKLESEPVLLPQKFESLSWKSSNLKHCFSSSGTAVLPAVDANAETYLGANNGVSAGIDPTDAAKCSASSETLLFGSVAADLHGMDSTLPPHSTLQQQPQLSEGVRRLPEVHRKPLARVASSRPAPASLSPDICPIGDLTAQKLLCNSWGSSNSLSSPTANYSPSTTSKERFWGSPRNAHNQAADARDDLSSNWTADEHSMAYENVPVRKFSRRTFSGPSDSSPAGT